MISLDLMCKIAFCKRSRCCCLSTNRKWDKDWKTTERCGVLSGFKTNRVSSHDKLNISQYPYKHVWASKRHVTRSNSHMGLTALRPTNADLDLDGKWYHVLSIINYQWRWAIHMTPSQYSIRRSVQHYIYMHIVVIKKVASNTLVTTFAKKYM